MSHGYLYRETHAYIAQVQGGLEEAGAEELRLLGAGDVQSGIREIRFTAGPETLYRVNYSARLITRVLAPLVRFPCEDPDALYLGAKAVDWPAFFTPDHTFAVFANVSGSAITHSQFAALRLKDAIVDLFRDRYGKRPDVDPRDPDVWINLHLRDNVATISIDTSGGSLHRRGYRRETVEAPMQETLAAGIIRLSGWTGDRLLYDPMCGSGTLLLEAAMAFCRIPAGILRPVFGFQYLPDFDPPLWQRVRRSADREIRPLPAGTVGGSDISSQAVRAAKTNLSLLSLKGNLSLETRDFRDIPSLENAVIVTNPPYGVRMGKDADLPAFYRDLGDFLKQRCKGSTAFIYFGNRELLKFLGLRPSFKLPLKNGGLDGRLVKYEIR